MLWGIVIATVLVVSSVTAETECEVDEFVKCMEPIHNASSGHPHGLFQTVADLSETCPILKTGKTCVNDYATKCGTEMIAENFDDQFAKPMKLIDEICNLGSSFRSEYLQISPCMLEKSEEISECTEKVQDFLSHFEPDTDEKEKTLACMFEIMFRACLMSTTLNSCGLDAASFVRKALQYSPSSGMKLCFDTVPL